MDKELSDSIRDIRGAIETQGQQTRGEIGKVHARIDTEKDIRQKEAAAHDKESAVRANQLNNDISNANGTAADAVEKVETHTKWHKDQKTSSRGMWVAIGLAIISGVLGMLQKCAPDF